MITEVGGAEAASKGTIYDANGYRQRAKDQLLMAELGRTTEAVAEFREAIRLKPGFADARANLAHALGGGSAPS